MFWSQASRGAAGDHLCQATSVSLLSTCAPAFGEKHQAASSALLLKHTLCPTLMVSGRISCSSIDCPVDCTGCLGVLCTKIIRAACNGLQLCSRSVLCYIAVADAAA